MYSTSHVYDGRENVRLNRDLNGLRFSDMPWILSKSGEAARSRGAAERTWPESSAKLPRLVALGQDAWSLSQQLRNSGLLSGGRIDGVTGELSIDSYNRVHRNPMWAHFVGGKTEVLPAAAEPVPVFEDSGASPGG